jgi:mannose-6-phosphate isomerase-like protein (cupin superfamily)
MSPNLRTAETAGGHVIENPLSGERITILPPDPRADGSVLDWQLVLAPGGQVPSSHAHPRQEESFTVLEGRMRFRIRGRRVMAGPGDTVRVPPGTVHHFANAGRQPARVAVRTRPALSMQELLETAAAMATEQHAAARRLPRPLDLALFMSDFQREVRAPYLPAALVGAVIRPLARLARRRDLDGRYRSLRYPSVGQPSVGQPSVGQPSVGQPAS